MRHLRCRCLDCEIRRLTFSVTMYRQWLELERDMSMANLFEIKGLGAAVADAKKGISQVRAETAGLSADAGLLITAVQGVRQQIKQAHDDLQFEAEQLGNGSVS